MTRGARPGRTILLRLSAAAAAVVIALGIAGLIWHDRSRAEVLRAAAQSPAAAAGIIAEKFGASAAICQPRKPGDDLENLVSALFALERFGVSPFEAQAERWIARLSPRLGLAPPDLSYGAGQIRLSRAIALAGQRHAGKRRNAGSNQRRDSAAIRARMAGALLDACLARQVARRLLETGLDRKLPMADADCLLSHDQIIRLAAMYNAQAAPGDAKAALAHRLFTRIAYHLTLHYRYADGRRGPCAMTTSASRSLGWAFPRPDDAIPARQLIFTPPARGVLS
jgi:hypothetical protein